MKKLIATILIVLGAYACAEDASATDAPLDHAIAGQVADVGTTAVGLAAGMAEANPLGLALLPLKAGLVYYADSIEDPTERCESLRATGNLGFAPAAANLATLAGAAPPVALVVAVVTFLTLQHSTADACQ